MLHNESVNVWSHLLGVTIFLSILIWTIVKINPFINYLKSGSLSTSDNLLKLSYLPKNTHSSISVSKDGIYIFEDFLNISLADHIYSENESEQLWEDSWEYEI